jgi:hypothetical protein
MQAKKWIALRGGARAPSLGCRLTTALAVGQEIQPVVERGRRIRGDLGIAPSG